MRARLALDPDGEALFPTALERAETAHARAEAENARLRAELDALRRR